MIIRRFRKKPSFCVVLHFAIIKRTISTPHDCEICTPFLSRLGLAGEFELFTKPSKSDFLRVYRFFDATLFLQTLNAKI
jgi:hypothetical protein